MFRLNQLCYHKRQSHIDIVVRNDYEANQILLNDRDNTFTVSDLPSGDMWTRSIALGDMNGDGHIDIVVGCRKKCSLEQRPQKTTHLMMSEADFKPYH